MPIAWLDQYLLGAREIPLGHCSPCCRIDLLGCCNLKIHLFCALCLSLCSGLLSNGGSFGRPLVSAAAGRRGPSWSLGHFGLQFLLQGWLRAAGRWGKGREEGKGPRRGGGGWQEEGRGEKGNRYHLTFNLSLKKKKKNLSENYIDPFLITLRHCSLLKRGLRCLRMYFTHTSPSPLFRGDQAAAFPSPSRSHLGWTQSYASLAKGVFLN